jgi:single-stranded-DNA-specific exonuclease
MQASALASLENVEVTTSVSLVLHDTSWHPGVVGLLASRLRERFHRPTLCFAAGTAGELKGSGRSIPALHLRDALDLVDRRHPGLMLRFGGHAAAAGVSIGEASLPAFRAAFEAVAASLLSPADLQRVIETDGGLDPALLDLGLAQSIRDEVWGQGFAAPLFADDFRVRAQRVVGNAHTKLELVPDDGLRTGSPVGAMLFRHDQPLPPRIRAAYQVDVNEWNGERSVQLTLEHWEPAA